MLATDRFFNSNSDFRNDFEKDRDRIIHSYYFRLLEYKTQVFINGENDFYRTRLTHTLEVAQIARSISQALELNSSLAEAIALAHDLGHTPFGHVGGDELSDILNEVDSNSFFDHNLQSFKVVTSLECRDKLYNGLNLTYATLEGILKHSPPYDTKYIPSEVRDAFNLDYHPTVEAMVVDRADEIAYISHDIEDGIISNIINYDDILNSRLASRIYEENINQDFTLKDGDIFIYKFTKNFINFLITNFLENSMELRGQKNSINLFKKDEEIPVGFDSEIEEEIIELKKILFNKFYKNKRITIKMQSGKVIIRNLFNIFNDDTNLLPNRYRESLKYKNKFRVVADYIASLSDRAATNLYKELNALN